MSLAIQGSRLVASRRSQQVLVPRPVNDWTGISEHTPSSDRSLVTSRQRLNFNGTLQSVSVVIKSGSPTDGRVHCRIVLEDEDRNERATLCMGYQYPGHEVFGSGAMGIKLGDQIRIESRSSLSGVVLSVRGRSLIDVYGTGGWTGMMQGSLEGQGHQRTFQNADPAAGAELLSQTVPTGARWEIKSILGALVADATAIDREPQFIINDGTINIYSTGTGIAQPATATRTYVWSTAGANQVAVVQVGDINITIPPMKLLAGFVLSTITANIQTGDNWGPPNIQVAEWIAP